MLSLIKKLFARGKAPTSVMDMLMGKALSPEESAQLEADCEKRSQELLQALPRCTASVVIAGPSYSDKHYFGDVVADTAALLPWAVHHAANAGRDAVGRALPTWLMGADLSNSAPSLVTEPFHQVLRRYALDLVMKNIARAHCPKCNHFVSEIKTEMHELEHDGVFQWFMDEWRCPAGHLMHREKNGISVYSRKASAPSGGRCC